MELNEIFNLVMNVMSSNIFVFIAIASIGLGVIKKTIKLSFGIAIIALLIHISMIIL